MLQHEICESVSLSSVERTDVEPFTDASGKHKNTAPYVGAVFVAGLRVKFTLMAVGVEWLGQFDERDDCRS